jgi:hypothetical protein
MKPEEATSNERREQATDEVRQAQRRDKAFLNSPTTAPKNFSGKEVRRIAQEAREDLIRRG